MANSDYTLLAKQVLHDLELELGTRVGAMEHNLALREVVEDTLAEHDGKVSACNCDCKSCSLGDHTK